MAVNYYTEQCDYLFKGKGKTTLWIKQCIANEGLTTGEISYIFCNSAYHINVNRQYLGHDYYTDIITFDYGHGQDSSMQIVSGDIFIDYQTVALNAAEYGVSQEQEMQRVVIHGILHLCGYNDKTHEEQKKMREKEDFYLNLFK